MLMFTALLAAVTLACAAAWAFAPRRELVTEVEIAASPDEVWRVLADGAAYPAWNPFLVAMEGPLRVGARLTNTMQPSPGQRMVFRPTVLAARPAQELRWLGRFAVPRLFDGEHYFLLEARATGTRLVHGERFRGVALWLVDPEQFRANFDAMNAALKARVEGAASAGER